MADSTKMSEERIYEVLSAVDEIPEGKVASYGQVAKLIGRDRKGVESGGILRRVSVSQSGKPCGQAGAAFYQAAGASAGRGRRL